VATRDEGGISLFLTTELAQLAPLYVRIPVYHHWLVTWALNFILVLSLSPMKVVVVLREVELDRLLDLELPLYHMVVVVLFFFKVHHSLDDVLILGLFIDDWKVSEIPNVIGLDNKDCASDFDDIAHFQRVQVALLSLSAQSQPGSIS